MKEPAKYWKAWFDERARNATSDFVLNRGTTLRLNELERDAQRQFLAAVNPKPQDIILDAGCGSGRNISILSPLVKEVVGLDYSEQMLQRARERVAEERLNNVKLLTGDVTQLQFETGTFNTVVCASVLQYLDDNDCAQALNEMARVCRSEGRLILHIKNGTSIYGLSLKVLRLISGLLGRRMKPEYYRSRRWHEKTIQKLGGVVVEHDGFGFLTFVPLPRRVVALLLRAERHLPLQSAMKRWAVNYKMTVRVKKLATTG